MDAGIGRIESRRLGLFRPSAAGRTAEDDGDPLRGIVLYQAALCRCLAGRDDRELRGAVGRGDDTGAEVPVWVEVRDEGRLSKSKTISRRRCLRKQAEGRDPAAAQG